MRIDAILQTKDMQVEAISKSCTWVYFQKPGFEVSPWRNRSYLFPGSKPWGAPPLQAWYDFSVAWLFLVFCKVEQHSNSNIAYQNASSNLRKQSINIPPSHKGSQPLIPSSLHMKPLPADRAPQNRVASTMNPLTPAGSREWMAQPLEISPRLVFLQLHERSSRRWVHSVGPHGIFPHQVSVEPRCSVKLSSLWVILRGQGQGKHHLLFLLGTASSQALGGAFIPPGGVKSRSHSSKIL